ncbi:MAG: hypothetical protein E6R13_01950 [Spirochaetes bacterium]|nr:MAG: hypothetical protein E6R13_01950 [Spirochaetota bacterium]
MLKAISQYFGFSKPIETDFRQIAINTNYKLECGNSNLEEKQRVEIAEKFEEASDRGSNEITMPNLHPNVSRDLLAIGYTISDGKCSDYHRIGGNVVEFREIPCKIIKLPYST